MALREYAAAGSSSMVDRKGYSASVESEPHKSLILAVTESRRVKTFSNTGAKFITGNSLSI